MITAQEAKALCVAPVPRALLMVDESIRKLAPLRTSTELKFHLSQTEVKELAALIKAEGFRVRFEDYDEEEDYDDNNRITWLVEISW
jgi:hypothetical protein